MKDLSWKSALYLENGHLFQGHGFGATEGPGGEAVFNTGMTGYQEIYTDPSYSEQIVVMGAPQIGNTGINSQDVESDRMSLKGVVAREYCPVPSNWRSEMSLGDYLRKGNIPGISGVDTRRITQILRDEGAQNGVIFPVGDEDPIEQGKRLLVDIPSMEGRELVSQASCKEPYVFSEVGLPTDTSAGVFLVYDFGVKRNILRHLQRNHFKVQVVPYNTSASEALAYKPSAIMLSNGPGDPAGVPDSVITAIGELVGKVPLMAICMGHQLLGRAMGFKTYKLKFGHHGINHPVKDLLTGRILITSQNHGFAVEKDGLSADGVVLSHINLNDHTVSGFQSEKQRFLSLQFHPEAKPGPSDAAYLFETFVKGFVQ